MNCIIIGYQAILLLRLDTGQAGLGHYSIDLKHRPSVLLLVLVLTKFLKQPCSLTFSNSFPDCKTSNDFSGVLV